MKRHNYSLKGLKPVKINDLIRIGNQETDGGYVISTRLIERTKVLIGLGVSYDWSFEEDFKAKKPDAEVYCFDFSVSKKEFIKRSLIPFLEIVSPVTWAELLIKKKRLSNILARPYTEIKTLIKFNNFFYKNSGNYFFKKGISDNKTGLFITVDEMFQEVNSLSVMPDNSIFIKVDIEGSEYDILEHIYDYKNKINGLAIEFHDLKHLWEDFTYLINFLKKDFEVIHIHANNVSGYILDTKVPMLVEVSLIKRELLSPSELESFNDQTYPIAQLDKPNVDSISDLALFFD